MWAFANPQPGTPKSDRVVVVWLDVDAVELIRFGRDAIEVYRRQREPQLRREAGSQAGRSPLPSQTDIDRELTWTHRLTPPGGPTREVTPCPPNDYGFLINPPPEHAYVILVDETPDTVPVGSSIEIQIAAVDAGEE